MKKRAMIWLLLFTISASILQAGAKPLADEIALKEALYCLAPGESVRDITSDILAQPTLPPAMRQTFIEQKRRFFVFWYPSDGLKVKSMVSTIDGPSQQSLVVLLRGASRMEALPAFLYPSKELLFCSESRAIIVAGCYRDGVSEGVDEYGGEDVNDVAHLTAYLPTLLHTLDVQADPQRQHMVGVSRGGMQMFLALAKFPELQTSFCKFVSLSGLLNLDLFASNNPDWCDKMERHFGFDRSQEWLDQRNPLHAVAKMGNKHLPFLLVQGTADPKVCVEEGYSMLQAMKTDGFTNVHYWEVGGGDHTLKNHPEYVPLILAWLEL